MKYLQFILLTKETCSETGKELMKQRERHEWRSTRALVPSVHFTRVR